MDPDPASCLRHRRIRRLGRAAQPRAAQHPPAARAVDGADRARRPARRADRHRPRDVARHRADRLPGGAFGFMFAIEKTKNWPPAPVLLGFTFMGLMLARLIGAVLGLANGASLIMMAFASTGVVFLGMAALSTVIKRDLSAMGKFLFIGAIMVLVAASPTSSCSRARADADAVGAGDRHLLGLHPSTT